MIKVINDLCGIRQAYITTIHSYTTDQSLHDQPHQRFTSRSWSKSIYRSTTTGAASINKIFSEFEIKIGGCGIRDTCT
jgi:glyceraldehyde 3-phosphate dehydrogenase